MDKALMMVASVQDFIGRFSPVQRVLLGTSLILVTSLPTLMRAAANLPRYRTVASGVQNEAELTKLVHELEKQDIDVQVAEDGKSLLVPEAKAASALRALRKSQIHADDPTLEFKDMVESQGPFYMNPELQRLQRLRCLEGEVAKTIMFYDVVEFARVHISKPKPGLYRSQEKPVTASIFLELHPDKKLRPKQVRAILELTANAVEGLKPENITLCDSWGTRYSDAPADVMEETPETPATPEEQKGRVTEITRTTEALLLTKVDATLTRLFGENCFTSSLNVALAPRSAFPKVKTQARSRSLIATNQRAPTYQLASIAGAFPGTLPMISALSDSDPIEIRTSASTEMELEPDSGPGGGPLRISRLSLSVLIDSLALPQRSLDAALRENVEQHLKSAVGYCPSRGDQFMLMAVPFLAPKTPSRSVTPPTGFWKFASDNLYLFWGVQLAFLMTVMVVIVRNSRHQGASSDDGMDLVPLGRFKDNSFSMGGLESLQSRIARLSDDELRERLAMMDRGLVSQAVRLLEDRERERVLVALDESVRKQVMGLMSGPIPLKQMERSLAKLARSLEEAE